MIRLHDVRHGTATPRHGGWSLTSRRDGDPRPTPDQHHHGRLHPRRPEHAARDHEPHGPAAAEASRSSVTTGVDVRRRCGGPRTMIGPGPFGWCPGRIRTCDTRFRSSIRARPWGRRRLVRRSCGGAAVCRRPASLMSALDVNGTAPELGRPPKDRPVGPPTATTCAGPRTATTPGRSVGRRRPAGRATGRPTSGAGCTRDRTEHRRPYGKP